MTKSLFLLLLACAGAAHADIWHNGDLTRTPRPVGAVIRQ